MSWSWTNAAKGAAAGGILGGGIGAIPGGIIGGFMGGRHKVDPASGYPAPEHPGHWRQGHAAGIPGGGMEQQGGAPPLPSFAPAGGGQGGGGMAPMAGQPPQFGPMAPGMQRRGFWPQGGMPMGQPMGGGGYQPGAMIGQNPMGGYGSPMGGRGEMGGPQGGMHTTGWFGDLIGGISGGQTGPGTNDPSGQGDLGRGHVNPEIQRIRQRGGNYR